MDICVFVGPTVVCKGLEVQDQCSAYLLLYICYTEPSLSMLNPPEAMKLDALQFFVYFVAATILLIMGRERIVDMPKQSLLAETVALRNDTLPPLL